MEFLQYIQCNKKYIYPWMESMQCAEFVTSISIEIITMDPSTN